MTWVSAQSAPKVEVLAGPGRPSSMLVEHLGQHAEEFVVFDLGLFVQLLVGDALGGAWEHLEEERHRLLRAVLDRVVEGATNGSVDDPLPGMARAAAALLTGGRQPIDRVPQPWQADARAVFAAAKGVTEWLPGKPAIDWRLATPQGAYDTKNGANLPALFRATCYLRECLARLPKPLADEWRRRCNAVLDDELAAGCGRAAAAMTALLGVGAPVMPGLIADLPLSAVRDRDLLSAVDGPWWERLAAAHGAESGGDCGGLRGSLLRVAHELATEVPAGTSASVFAPSAWSRKRLDLADYTYVGVREVDALAGVMGVLPDARRPQLLVEPLPRTLAALRVAIDEADRVWQEVDGSVGLFADVRACLDEVARLLEHQQAGSEPPLALLDSLWASLTHHFDEQDSRQGVEVRIDGIDGRLRRCGACLVRMPIVWRGDVKTAIAFQWCVEHEVAPGRWERAQRTARER